MGKKDRHFSKSQEWLDWLSDAKVDASPASAPKPSATPLGRSEGRSSSQQARQYVPRPAPRPTTSPLSHSLGLDPSVFRTGSSTAQPIDSSRPKKTRQDSNRTQGGASSEGTITLNFHLPSIKFPRIHADWRKIILYSGTAVIIVGIIFGTPLIIKSINNHKVANTPSDGSNDKPSFATVTPAKDTAGYVQQSQKYDPTKQVYNFKGQYNGIDVIGTEQALPDIFKTNKNKLKEQAQMIGATEHIDVVGGDAYISPVEGNTSQRAVYASGQILVFVTYSGVMKSSEWVKFLQSLE